MQVIKPLEQFWDNEKEIFFHDIYYASHNLNNALLNYAY